MFVVFLDIDGVLVTWRAMAEKQQLGTLRGGEAFDEEPVAVFNRFIEKTGAKVVISSDWRRFETVESMQAILTRNGVRCQVIGLTEHDPDDLRGKEIRSWLQKNGDNEQIDYVVIDDNVEGIKDYIPAENIIHVEAGLMSGGLTEEHLRVRSSMVEQLAVNQ